MNQELLGERRAARSLSKLVKGGDGGSWAQTGGGQKKGVQAAADKPRRGVKYIFLHTATMADISVTDI